MNSKKNEVSNCSLWPLSYLPFFYLMVSAILRVILYLSFDDTQLSMITIAKTVAVGLPSDLIIVGCFNIIPLLYLALSPTRLLAQRWQRSILGLITFTSIFAVLYLAVAEFFFFEEFNSRFNLVAVDYLIYPHEVLINIWDSYPVLTIILIALFATASIFSLLWPRLKTMLKQLPQHRSTRRKLTAIIAIFPLAILFSTNSFYFSESRIINQISANGISSLFQAFRTNELNYNNFYRTIDRNKAFSILRSNIIQHNQLYCSPHNDDINRFNGGKKGLGQLNVVIIVEESFGANYVGSLGDKRHLTPNFDQLSQLGLSFTNCYATGTRTVRGLEAITASFPPIPSESIIKRPGNEGIANWGSVMNEQGYRSSFIYGGYGYFDNMNPFYRSNGFEIQDRSNIEQPEFTNIWGVSDEDLFDHAIGYFDQQEQPFFSIIMTTSNHKPYTFPEGIEGVQAQGGGRKAGIRYADYALGQFFDRAEQCSWYDDTVFVVVADHGARVYGKAQVPMKSYEIPLLILAPKHIAAQKVETLTSQMDIAPTVLGLLGLPYSAPFYGQDVFSLESSSPRSIFLNHNHDVALYQNQQLIVLGLNKTATTVHYNPDSDEFTPTPNDADLVNLATAYYQTAFDLFSHHRYL